MFRKKSLINASSEKCFRVYNGPAVFNLKELKEVLKNMSDDQFFYHANEYKNDFARWTEEILEDKKCADELQMAKKRLDAVHTIENALKGYRI